MIYSKSQQLAGHIQKKKAKKVSITKLKNRCIEIAKQIVKIRDHFTCQHCHAVVSGSNCQASHVAPVSSGKVLCADPINMKVLCYHCHLNWWHKDPTEAGEWFKNEFPFRYDYIQRYRHTTVKRNASDWLEIEQKLKTQLEAIQKKGEV